jgi:FkbM family methyltransferase
MDFGRGEVFRSQMWLERAAGALRMPFARIPLAGGLRRAYEALLDNLATERLVSRFPGGERVRVAAAYRHVTWNRIEYEAFKSDIEPGHLVLDVGANVGAYAVLFAQWTGPTGHVFAFEPAPEARRGLEHHVRLNGCEERVSVRREAVTSGRGITRFRAIGSSGDNHITTGTSGNSTDVEVPTTSIDEFCEELRVSPTFIKVDVEGAELDVLRGARRTIAAAGDTLGLYVEMHPSRWGSFGASRERIERELEAQGLRAERIDGSAATWELEGVCLRLRRCGS